MRTRAAADLTALAAQYVDDLRTRRYSSSSIEKAQLELGRLCHHLREQRITDARAVTEAHLAAYAQTLAAHLTRASQPLAPASRAAALSVVRRFFAWLEARAIVLQNPARILTLPRSVSLPRGVLTAAHARRLMAAPCPHSPIGQRDRAILELLYGAGLRLGEAARSDVTDLDLRSGVLLVCNGKGRKDRIVPICGAAATALELYLARWCASRCGGCARAYPLSRSTRQRRPHAACAAPLSPLPDYVSCRHAEPGFTARIRASADIVSTPCRPRTGGKGVT